MKNSISLTAIGTTLLAATANLHALELRDCYVEVDLGGSLMQDTKIKSDVSNSGGTITYNPGLRGVVAFGTGISPSFNAELETGFLWNSIDTIAGDSPSENSSLVQIPIMGNVIYKIPFKANSTPYIGAGVGGVVGFMDLHTPLGTVNNADFTFGYQAMAGWKFHVSDKVDLGLAYRFLGTLDHDWSDHQVTFKTHGAFNHSFLATLTYKF
jgi:opacity protein-like surface antigen